MVITHWQQPWRQPHLDQCCSILLPSSGRKWAAYTLFIWTQGWKNIDASDRLVGHHLFCGVCAYVQSIKHHAGSVDDGICAWDVLHTLVLITLEALVTMPAGLCVASLLVTHTSLCSPAGWAMDAASLGCKGHSILPLPHNSNAISNLATCWINCLFQTWLFTAHKTSIEVLWAHLTGSTVGVLFCKSLLSTSY